MLALVGCAHVSPPVDECAGYDTRIKQVYCYASKEVATARRAVAQSLLDGAIKRDDAIEARDILNRADLALDTAERLIIAGEDDEAGAVLHAVREILLEIPNVQ